MTLVLFSALSLVSASDLSGNMTVSESDDQNTNAISNIQQGVLGDGQETFDDLDSVIHDDSVPEGGVIELNSDYTFSDGDEASVGTNGISIDKNITINGKGHTLDASNKSSIFRIIGNSHVILINITFINGNATDGGAIYVESGSSIEIKDSTFQDNFASNNGGAIFIDGDSLTSTSTIHNSVFTKNSALKNGGAIYDTSSTLNVTLSDFSYNAASKYGGSMYVGGEVHISQTTFDHENASGGGAIDLVSGEDTHSTIENSIFKNCYASGDGGACYINSNNVNVKNVKFFDNIAGDDGGALYWEGSYGIIYNITATNNKGISIDKNATDTSSTRGGAICLTGSNVTLSHSTFTLCSAYMDESKDSSKVDGGALFVTGNGTIIENVIFTDCNATNNGGALYVIGNHTRIMDCSFSNSNAKDGAALYVDGMDCKLYNSTFSNNIAADDGGAIYWEGSDGLMYNITCTNNKGISKDKNETDTSSTRGGTICLTGDNVTINKSSFSSSSAYMDAGKDSSKVDGGALFITGNNVTIIETSFDDCNATNYGAAIYIMGNSSQILSCNFTNTQAYVGGAIFIAGNDGVVDNSLFRYNTGSDKGATGGSGGAIYVEGDGATISNSDFAYGKVINYGGAISVWGKDANIINNAFDNCTSTSFYGGAIYVNGANTTISLSNFTRSKAEATFARGGAIDISGEDSKILDCNFDSCYAYFGGDIYVNGANAIINNSDFKHSATFDGDYSYEGGAIYVNGYNTTISKSNFTDFTSSQDGGAIYVNGIQADISESNFVDCYVRTGHGGAIYIAGENTNIEDSNFTSCEALNRGSYGGAIYVFGANSIVNGSNFDGCGASRGGDIYVFGNYVKIDESTFTSSYADYGGAIYLDAWGALIKQSNISDCNAADSGGAIYVAGGGTNIQQSRFEDCIAKGTSQTKGGGAIYVYGPDTHISDSDFNNDRVISDNARGGTIFINGVRTIIEGSDFNDSYAGEGGIIYIEGEKAIIATSTFANSSSKYYGGAISVHGHNATITGSTFGDIQADSHGGAIYVDGENTNILYSSFDNCKVNGNNYGGAIYIDDVGTTVAYSNFTHSKAAAAGAIHISGENTTISYCNLDNNTANYAGAIRVSGDNTIISHTNFTYNIATTSTGGALDIGGENASVYYSWFDHNEASGNGGAINWIGGHGDDSIIGSTFSNNTCRGSEGGGAIYWTAGAVISSGGLIKDSLFINNTAANRHGGAIDWYRALDSKIDNCIFIENYASRDGGALYTGDQGGNSHNLTITNCQFYNNTATKSGGALANQMGDSYIYNNVFDGNKAGYCGGSILMKEGPARNSVVDHCYIYNSFCNQPLEKWEGGGAIHIEDQNITISNCAIINSTANKTYGGAIAILSTDCSLINVSIQNVATNSGNGGAIYWSKDRGYLNNVTIFNSSSNSAYDREANGGAIYLSGWDCKLNDIHITTSSSNNNDSTSSKTAYGGSIYITGGRNVLTNVDIDDSQSTSARYNSKGGAIYWAGEKGTLENATISNTLSNGQGGAIYWSGSSPVSVNNITISYSQTKVEGSTNDASGGAIYSTSIGNLKDVYIENAIASTERGNVYGGGIYYNGNTMTNVTVVGSRATTESGNSYGGAVYWKKGSSDNAYIYNSSFEENNADFGGAIYFDTVTSRIYDTNFTGNVANKDGGAIYGTGKDILLYRVLMDKNSAKRGGAIFAQNVEVKIYDSALEFNTAEEKGGAIYRNTAGTSSEIKNTRITNNTAFQGSAIYTVAFFTLKDTVLLDNQANSNKFINKVVGVDDEGKNYTSAVFVGYDNLLNAIWCEEDYIGVSCSNVTYWDAEGITISNSKPRKSNCEAGQNITVELYNHDGELLDSEVVVTDEDGAFKYTFVAEDGETYYFAYIHESDRYYTYLRDTLSNSSLVKIYINDFYYGGNTTMRISLTDGAGGSLSGNVTVEFNDTDHTNFTVEVINGLLVGNYTFNLPIGKYNATATYRGNITRLGDVDSNLFKVIPIVDLNITKNVNVTADLVNVSDIIEYTINVTNHGPHKAVDINVTEILSSYLKMLKNETTKGNYTGDYWLIDELDVNETATLTIVAQIIHMGQITNTVWVISDGYDTNMSNNVASARNLTAVPIVDLRIIKEINVTGTLNVTEIVKYVITVFNDGPCNATGVVIGEVLDYRLKLISNTTSLGTFENGTWNIPKLDNGTNATLTIVAQVIYSGNITNAVNVTSYENDTNMSNNYYNITNLAIAHVDLQINKTVNVTGPVNVTDQIKFIISIYNAGPANAAGVYVSEILSPHLRLVSSNVTIGEYDGTTWVIGNLNKGVVHNLTIVAEVISSGIISNAVNITGVDNDTNMSNNNYTIKNITALPIVDFEINKNVTRGGSIVNVSDVIEFTITVVNHGPCTATDINVTEVLSKHLKMTGNYTLNGYYDVSGGVWHVGDLTNGSSAVLRLVCEVISNGTISNFVFVTSNENDTNKSNNNDTIDNITALPVVDLQIIKESNITSGVVNVTDYIKYTITVHNNGPSNATHVNVTEVLSPYLRLDKNETHYGYYNVTSGIWYIGNLSNGSSAVLTLICEVIGNGTINNVVVARSFENDTNLSNNVYELNITANRIVDLRIVKTVNTTATEIDVTDVIQFNITVFNDGPCNATNVYVKEALSPYLDLVEVKASPGTSYDGHYTWVIGDLANGTNATLTIVARVVYSGVIENEVIVYCNETDTNMSNNRDNITNIAAFAHVDVGISKTCNVTGSAYVGEYVEFNITVYNNGPCNASGVVVTEALDLSHLELISSNATTENQYDGYSWVVGNLNKGETANLTIIAKIIAPGSIGNAVSVVTFDNDTNPDNDNDTIDNFTAIEAVDLEIIKNVTKGGRIVNVTDEIEFTITVKNKGPCDATNVTVVEVLDPHLKMTFNDTWMGQYNVTTGIWYIGDLPKGYDVSLIIRARVMSNGTISNFVSVNSTENDTNITNNNYTIENITAVNIVDLFISKEAYTSTGTNVVEVGDEIRYMIYVQNNGPCNATGVVVNETLSKLVELTGKRFEASNGTTYNPETGLWNIGNMTVLGSATLSIWVKVISNGTIENVVVVNSTENDTNPDDNNDSSENVTALPLVDLVIVKEVTRGGSVVNVSDIVEFTITVRNNGPSNATGVNVSEVLSKHLKMTGNYTLNGYYNVTEGIWHIGNLVNGSSAVLRLVCEVVSNGTISNFVVVSSHENETNPDDNNDTIDNITALPVVDLVIVKEVTRGGSVVNVSDIVEFTITVRNNGPSNATGVNVSEVLSKHLRMSGNYAENGYYNVADGIWHIGDLTNGSSAVLRLVCEVVSNGTISNFVVVSSHENETNPDDNNDTIDNITALPVVDVSVNKTVSVTEAHLGETITYLITVHNNGPSNATNVNVTEKLSNYVTLIEANPSIGKYNKTTNIWYIENLENGTTQTLTLKVQIIQKEIIENIVIVNSTENDTNVTNNNYTCENVTVDNRYTPISLDAYDIYYGDDEILTVTLPKNATGTVNITVNGREYPDLQINEGIVILPLSDLAGGNYTVDVAYGGDSEYLPNSTSGKFKVLPLTPIITIEVVDIWVGEVEVLNVTVNAPGTVFVTVWGKTVEIPLENGVITTDMLLKASSKPDYHGNATWNLLNLPVGRYPACAYYPGNENYTSASTSDVFYVRDLPSTVVVTADDIHVGEDAFINVKVGPKDFNGTVVVNVEGKNYTLPLKDGKANLTIPGLKAGLKHVKVWYNGTLLYRASQNTTTFQVLKYKPPIDVVAPEIHVGEDEKITVTVPKDATGTITIEIEGKTYTAPIKNGKAVFIVPGLKAGLHTIKAYYSGDDKYMAVNTAGEINVIPGDDGGSNHKHGFVGLTEHATGNPLAVLIVVMLSAVVIPLRKFRK